MENDKVANMYASKIMFVFTLIFSLVKTGFDILVIKDMGPTFSSKTTSEIKISGLLEAFSYFLAVPNAIVYILLFITVIIFLAAKEIGSGLLLLFFIPIFILVTSSPFLIIYKKYESDGWKKFILFISWLSLIGGFINFIAMLVAKFSGKKEGFTDDMAIVESDNVYANLYNRLMTPDVRTMSSAISPAIHFMPHRL